MDECNRKGIATYIPMKSDKRTDMIALQVESDRHETLTGRRLSLQ